MGHMGLTSEQAHWIVGGELSALALALMLYETRLWRIGALRYAPAAMLLLFAVEGTLLPVLHGDAKPGTIDAATAQHLALAGLCLVVGGVEFLRARGRLQQDIWRAPLPIGLFATGVVFWFHAQHKTDAPPILLTVQHRILGASLAVGAATKSVADLPHPIARRFGVSWLLPVFLAGVELLLYTEPGG
jgi:hypothetical protein